MTFDTVELLEMMVEHLLYQDIRNARGVSVFWRNMIDNSPQLKRQSFLKADFTSRGRSLYVWPNAPRTGADYETGHFVPATEESCLNTDDPRVRIAVPVVIGHPALQMGNAAPLWCVLLETSSDNI